MKSLNGTALMKKRMFGAAAGPSLLTDEGLSDLYSDHCGIITTDVALKWSRVRPTPDMIGVWKAADDLLSWSISQGIKLKGHPLIWNEFNPTWLWKDDALQVSVERARYVFDQHIDETVSRYPQIQHWDVVNEPIEPAHGRDDWMRGKCWMSVFGPSYVERALWMAHMANSKAKLFINENRTDQLIMRGGQAEFFRTKFLELIDRLLDKGAPLHGIGLQSHLIAWQMVTHEGTLWLLNELHKRGLEVHISEMDVAHSGNSNWGTRPDATIEEIDVQVAWIVGNYLKDVLSFPNVKAIITWQLSDLHSELVSKGHPRPLPFDANYQPKPFAYAIERAFENAT